MLFSGKNIIVTGASGDLGTAITQRLITQGANVLAVDSNTAGLSRLAAEVSGPGVLETFIADVSDAEQVLGYATHANGCDLSVGTKLAPGKIDGPASVRVLHGG
jgi:NAD(P)-dependent dehydrogenase (short-subunit alcohol dehydrogenase family)